MKLLEDKILTCGTVLPGDVLKVDSFLNHQIDIPFSYKLAEEFHRLYADANVTKILTVEASGIAIASLTALCFGCPLVFAKKSRSSNIGTDVFSALVHSYTHGNTNNIVVSKKYLNPDDRILVIDDFMANGCALEGLAELISEAGATLVGAGILIEKVYQGGGDKIRRQGIRIESLAKIRSMSASGEIVFAD